MPSPNSTHLNNQLRQQCRRKRRALTATTQKKHAQAACLIARRTRWFQTPKKIGCFLAQDGELATDPLIQALNTHHQFYLPVLKTLRGRPMAFAPYYPDNRMAANQFNIDEPVIAHQHHLGAHQLDLILMPLTCFDDNGHRIGMGGGFYDQSLAFKRLFPTRLKPILIGWAHECQKVSNIAPAPWDQPLDALITEKHLYQFTK